MRWRGDRHRLDRVSTLRPGWDSMSSSSALVVTPDNASDDDEATMGRTALAHLTEVPPTIPADSPRWTPKLSTTKPSATKAPRLSEKSSKLPHRLGRESACGTHGHCFATSGSESVGSVGEAPLGGSIPAFRAAGARRGVVCVAFRGPASLRRVRMRAQSTRSSAMRPASMTSWSAIPAGEVNEFLMIEPRLCLAADAAVT